MAPAARTALRRGKGTRSEGQGSGPITAKAGRGVSRPAFRFIAATHHMHRGDVGALQVIP